MSVFEFLNVCSKNYEALTPAVTGWKLERGNSTIPVMFYIPELFLNNTLVQNSNHIPNAALFEWKNLSFN